MISHEHEDQMRQSLRELAATAHMTEPAAAALLRAHRRAAYRRQATAVASVSAVGVVAGFAISNVSMSADGTDQLHVRPTSTPRRTATATSTCTSQPSGTATTSAPRASASNPRQQAQAQASAAQRAAARAEAEASARALDPDLNAVCLPAPAPGFPLRRGADTIQMTDFRGGVGVLARTFLLGTTAPIITHDRSGSDGGIPTGPEATVIVAAAGAFPTTPEAVHTSRQYPVIGTTTIRGRNATVVQPGMDRIGVLVRIGEFDIAAYGSYSAQPDHPVTVGQLVALIDSLQNIR